MDCPTACLIGVSGFGASHYNDLIPRVRRGEWKLLGATIINQSEELEKCEILRALGCEIYDDHQAMLAAHGSATDICFIPTGIHLHAPMTCNALRAGANVLVEKPAAATIQDIREMQHAERASGRFVAVGFQTMYAPETLWMKRAICEGRLGRVRTIKCRALWPRYDSYYSRNRWAGTLGKHGAWVLDSPFNNALAHQLNLMCFLAGTGLTQTASLDSIEAELYRAHDIESADTACLRISTCSGCELLFIVTHASLGQVHPEIIVEGDQGCLHWTSDKIWIEYRNGTREEGPLQNDQHTRDSMIKALRNRLHDPGVFTCDLHIASAHTRCVNGAHESSRVHPVDASWIRRFPHEGSVQTVIEGIDELTLAALHDGKLFSESGAPWATPGKRVSLKDYEFFSGPRTH